MEQTLITIKVDWELKNENEINKDLKKNNVLVRQLFGKTKSNAASK